ncbi:hypothetical protein [Thalassotalea ganghwensis]
MLYGKLALAVTVLSLSITTQADDFNFVYEPEPTFWDRLIDAGNSYVRRQIKKREDSQSAEYFGVSPTLSQWRQGTRNWEPGACLESNAKNSGVWLNGDVKSTSHSGQFHSSPDGSIITTPYKKFTISSGTPYELESKNFKRAGLKRFAKYYYSFRIDNERRDTSTVIDNKKSHDYSTTHTFSPGINWIHSTTFSDFEWSIGVKNNTGDFNYIQEWADPSNYSVRGSWGGDIYLSDCGFAEVSVEQNTRPVINGIDYKAIGTDGGYGAMENYYELHPYVEDRHTPSEKLNYYWEVNLWDTDRNFSLTGTMVARTRVFKLELPHRLIQGNKAIVKLIVSDGALSSTFEDTMYF